MWKHSRLLTSKLIAGCTMLMLPLAAHASTPSFTLSVANTTMPSSGDGELAYTLTSVDGYEGNFSVSCQAVNAPPHARIPICGGGPVVLLSLAANGTLSNELTLTPYGDAVPLSTVALLFGFGLVSFRRRLRGPALAFTALATSVGLCGLSSCGAGSGMTPGTYTYTVTANDMKTNASVSTTAKVTVH